MGGGGGGGGVVYRCYRNYQWMRGGGGSSLGYRCYRNYQWMGEGLNINPPLPPLSPVRKSIFAYYGVLSENFTDSQTNKS